MLNSEVDCTRYRGNDPQIGRRLVEIGLANSCDLAPPPDAKPIIRSHVSFRIADGAPRYRAAELAQDLLGHIGRHVEGYRNFTFEAKAVRGDAMRAAIEFALVPNPNMSDGTGREAKFNTIAFEAITDGEWLARTEPGGAFSYSVDDWLQEDSRFQDIRWFSAEQWRTGGPYVSTVI